MGFIGVDGSDLYVCDNTMRQVNATCIAGRGRACWRLKMADQFVAGDSSLLLDNSLKANRILIPPS